MAAAPHTTGVFGSASDPHSDVFIGDHSMVRCRDRSGMHSDQRGGRRIISRAAPRGAESPWGLNTPFVAGTTVSAIEPGVVVPVTGPTALRR